MNEESLFEILLKLPQAERAALLDKECVGKPDLRHRLEQRLEEHTRGKENPDRSTATVRDPERTSNYVPPATSEPNLSKTIGRYTLVAKIGEGGMGEVWIAEQSVPVRRRVALKLILGGRDSTSVVRRFEAERQALAIMDHPNIARIYDGGSTEQGRPFFVMELVYGVPLTRYCDENRLGIPQRLELFVTICQAVQHAHQKGIIHRDLKPGNILVAEVDGRPVPKVIDFGVAKATEEPLGEDSFGDSGAIVGTPAYMSPEQADPTSMDIDTRSDVFALGVILYELLVGSPPIDAKQFKRGAVLEMLRMVREVEPPKLSTKLSSSENAPNIAANRSTEPARLARDIRGDLDSIVMKALVKDRTQRYDSATGLAADVMRHLAGEAVLAHPPSRSYRLRKFVRRHKGPVIATSLMILTLMAGIIGTTLGLIEARQARTAESERAEGERQAKIEAQHANELTAARLKQIELINNSVFEIFSEFDIRKVKEERDPVEYVLAQSLIEAGKKLDMKVIGDPLVLASLQNRLGRTLWSLGEPRAAIEFLIPARASSTTLLGAAHPDTLETINNLGLCLEDAGKLQEALGLFEEAHDLAKANLGANHLTTIVSKSNLAEGYRAGGKFDEALPLYEEVLTLTKARLGAKHSDTLICMHNLAVFYQTSGLLAKAIPLHEKALSLRKEILEPNHPATLNSQANLAEAYRESGQFARALPMLVETLERRKTRLGADHPSTLLSMANLGLCYMNLRQMDKSIPLLEQTLELRTSKLGPDHPDTLISINTLAMGYETVGQVAKATPLYKSALKLSMAKIGADHPDTLKMSNNLGWHYLVTGQPAKALPILEETLRLRKINLRPDHPATLNSMANVGECYRRLGQMEKALSYFEESFNRREATQGPEHQDTLNLMGNLGKAYVAAGKGELAAKTLVVFVARTKRKFPPDSPAFAGFELLVALELMKCPKYPEAEAMLRDALTIREKEQPDAWTTYNTQSTLGGALLGQNKYTDAEPLLIEGYEGMKTREKSIPAQGNTRIPEALDRLIELYKATNKPNEVKKYQELKAKYPTPKTRAEKK